ncbi:MAG: ACP S-malonyltransferase [Lachnospiraceae bacterium]|nr:ACP S-malonyltransferase [Lachnospiraceae bacterium]
MGKIAFVFPGQGAQHIGMAREFYDTCPESREVFEIASAAAGYSLEEICFSETLPCDSTAAVSAQGQPGSGENCSQEKQEADGDRVPNEKSHQTRYTQPTLLCASLAILAAVRKAGIRADMTAGLSLGEYCALTAAGSLSVADAVKIVCQRGIYMEEAVPTGGAMTAILSRKPLPIEEICAATEGQVSVANYNCPGQQVISGEKEAVDRAAAKLLEAGASRAVPLKVSGPFHSPMLGSAGEKLAALLKDQEIQTPQLLFVSNVTGATVSEPEEIRTLLGRQVCNSVRWQQSMEYMIAAGADTFIEIGPGTTLTNFAKKIDRSVKALHVETPADLEQVAAALQ